MREKLVIGRMMEKKNVRKAEQRKERAMENGIRENIGRK